MNIEAIENPFAKVSTSLNRASASTTEQSGTLKEGEDGESSTAHAAGDTVTISQRAKNMSHITVSSKVLTRTEEEKQEETEASEDSTQERIKKIQEEMEEVQQELQELMASNMGQEEKMQKMQMLQSKLASLQTELSELMSPENSTA